MGLWSRLFAAFRPKMTPDEWFREFGDGGGTNSGVLVNETTAMRVATVMACVRVCSEDVAKLPPHIYRVDPKDGSRKEDRGHFLYQIFRKPNDWQTWFEFCEMMQTSLRMRGNAYAVVIRDGRGVPKQMIPISPDRVYVWESPGGAYFYNVMRMGLHDMAVLRDFPLLISSDDVFHLRWTASSNSLIALSPIGYARETIGLAIGQEMHAAKLIGAGARPSGVLQTDKRLNKETVDRVGKSWHDMHSGPQNAGKTAILEEGLKWQALTMSSVDLEFIAGRRLQAELICQIFRVAPFKVGITVGVSARNVEQIQLQHYTDTIHPDLVRWEQKLQNYFNLGDDEVVEFDIQHLVRADLAARANAARVLGMSGVLSPDENRISFGFNPRGGGADELFIGNNMATVENVAKGLATPGTSGPGIGSDQSGAPADGGDGDPAQLPTDDPALA